MKHAVFDELQDDKTWIVISFMDSLWHVELWDEHIAEDWQYSEPAARGVAHDLDKALDECHADYQKQVEAWKAEQKAFDEENNGD